MFSFTVLVLSARFELLYFVRSNQEHWCDDYVDVIDHDGGVRSCYPLRVYIGWFLGLLIESLYYNDANIQPARSSIVLDLIAKPHSHGVVRSSKMDLGRVSR
jgi:hypothetical protein